MEKTRLFKHVVPRVNLIPFVLITSCFALWGFANDITNPMVAAFQKIFLMGATEATLVQMAFYGGYGLMAIPAALFLRRYTYKKGILMGLTLYAIGGFLFLPASRWGDFYPFLLAYFIMTCGLSFLETSANPYILFLGDRSTATRRLNLAQAFNPLGSLIGMFVASRIILNQLDPRDAQSRQTLSPEQFEWVKQQDLAVVSGPYIAISVVLLVFIVAIAARSMPENPLSTQDDLRLRPTLSRLFQNRLYLGGVLAQTFYVGAQIMCWTFIIHYGAEVFMNQGMPEKEAQILAQDYNIVAMIIFALSRFICTFLLKYFSAPQLLTVLAIGGAALCAGCVVLGGNYGLYCLVAISACMSLMFPTIYGIALGSVSADDAKLAAAGLIMAIIGGTFLPLLQAVVIDWWSLPFLSGPRASFLLPLGCFIVIAWYGQRSRFVLPPVTNAGSIPQP